MRYYCKRSTFFVQVDAEMRNQTRAQGDQVRLNCEITGHPVPTYAWFKNDRRLDENIKMKRMKILSTYWGSSKNINNNNNKNSNKNINNNNSSNKNINNNNINNNNSIKF
ncbi:hypothetical protein HELRODRAFT_184413 [Helobdella robusta]|uniref:Ig-like domain-containing protein n=1 Tax=Helobdella robusta TaxID=6412 RepID=T1FL55_HELRO|nr:hypothetical protein HELRODRAFT_184413 [Helobdella robusta]ESN98198.1 hypothetical protein HELRODRAFT_184413 [Helobdella robusta]